MSFITRLFSYCCPSHNQGYQQIYSEAELGELLSQAPPPVQQPLPLPIAISPQVQQLLPANIDLKNNPSLPKQIEKAAQEGKKFEVRTQAGSTYLYFPQETETTTFQLLDNLPENLVIEVLGKLSVGDIFVVGQVAKRYWTLTHDGRLFKIFLEKCYPHIPLQPASDFQGIWKSIRGHKFDDSFFQEFKLTRETYSPASMKITLLMDIIPTTFRRDEPSPIFPSILSTFAFPPAFSLEPLLPLMPPALAVHAQQFLATGQKPPAMVCFISDQQVHTMEIDILKERITYKIWDITDKTTARVMKMYSFSQDEFPQMAGVAGHFKSALAAGRPPVELDAEKLTKGFILPYVDCKGNPILLFRDDGKIYKAEEEGRTLLIDLGEKLTGEQIFQPVRFENEMCFLYAKPIDDGKSRLFLVHLGEGGAVKNHSPVSLDINFEPEFYYDPKYKTLLIWNPKEVDRRKNCVYLFNTHGECQKILPVFLTEIRSAFLLPDYSVCVANKYSAQIISPSGRIMGRKRFDSPIIGHVKNPPYSFLTSSSLVTPFLALFD